MRTLTLNPQYQHPSPLVVMALCDEQQGEERYHYKEVCHHYRTTRNHGSFNGLELVIANNDRETGQVPNGITLDGLLAICEDRARHDTLDPVMKFVAIQLLAARRA